ncbi:FAD-binding domain-containing protein [Rhizodiscina lignyota]|uniref:FAD-binding domain-containing protein n=1 Tax=Rhizodiscina lignyota TaxID=1504668 RepID=A0A9P4I8S4_9PEZI|nr:FAD-binding domain-containing protein [Rhizodiscina lignyota]
MEALPVAAGWAINNLSPQKILKSIGLGSLLLSLDPIERELGGRLSKDASILLPSAPNFKNASDRWQNEYKAPQISSVVNVKTEEDVQETIRYANEHERPFIAMAGGHGQTGALSHVRDGIQIDLRAMDQVVISEDGKSAVIGGGAKVKKVVDELWAFGKETVTGICECVGIAAPMLGGGHGWNQGKYGLGIDQLIEARIVLSNGTAVTASEKSNPDLFWAIRGAGHNFGIVTEMKYKIYDVDSESTRAFEFFYFAEDKLEALYTQANELLKTQPANIVHWSFMVMLPFDSVHINEKQPTLIYAIVHDGPASYLKEYATPIRDLGPIHTEAGELSMPALAAIAFMDEGGAGCARGLTGLRFPIIFDKFDVPAVRKVYNHYDKTLQQYPQFNGSFFLLEQYSTQAVKAVPDESTAFPHREYDLLLTPYIVYKPDPRMDPIAETFGRQMREYLLRGSESPDKLMAYVNYAHGDESLEALYGWDEWRLEKLRKLKAEWDPLNRMRWYAPIV